MTDFKQKTIDLGNLPAPNTVKRVPHGIANLDQVRELRGIAHEINSGGEDVSLPLPFVSASAQDEAQIQITVLDDDVVVATGSRDRSNMTGVVFLGYTTTGD